MPAPLKLRILFQIALLLLVALTSGLQTPEFIESNWDIVLFLTPLGILKNLLAVSPVLRSFYLDISPGQTPLSLAQAGFMILLYALVVVNGLAILREVGRRKG